MGLQRCRERILFNVVLLCFVNHDSLGLLEQIVYWVFYSLFCRSPVSIATHGSQNTPHVLIIKCMCVCGGGDCVFRSVFVRMNLHTVLDFVNFVLQASDFC